MKNSKEIRALGPSFPKSPKLHKDPISWITQSSNGLYTRSKFSFYIKFGVEHFGSFFVYPCPCFGIFGTNFPDLPQFPKNTTTGITQLPDSVYTWVRFHLMWNLEFNTLNDFLDIHAHNLGYLGPIFPTCPNPTNTLKTV